MAGITVFDLIGESKDQLATATRDGVLFVVLNRPEARNAMNIAMRKRFGAVMALADADDAIDVVIITGLDPAFSGGVDIKEITASAVRPPMVRPHPGEALRAMTKPVIAAVNGVCVTGALEVAVSCAFIIASERAQFGDTHARMGLFPSWGLSALLPRFVGFPMARQLSLTGKLIDSEKALQCGLVNEVTKHEDLLSRCFEIATHIRECEKASVRQHIHVFREADGVPLATALDIETRAAESRRSDPGAQDATRERFANRDSVRKA